MRDDGIYRIKRSRLVPSAAIGLKLKHINHFLDIEKVPEVGDVIYGEVTRIGQHASIENKSGRIHRLFTGSRSAFVFGNRYAPDYYESFIPKEHKKQVDMVARSGVVGVVKNKNAKKKDPTRIKILGYMCDKEGNLINTRNHPLVVPNRTEKKSPRAKMIVVVGTSMNSGKSRAAAAVVRALTILGESVRASKITGTASLKDILNMNDAGAEKFADFSYLGYPSTYMLTEEEVLDVYNKLDLKFANTRSNYWVVEIADGINQRETAMLLSNKEFQQRIHKLIFAAGDAMGAIGGIDILNKKYGLTPDLISGVLTSSPLHIEELKSFSKIPVFKSADPSIAQVKNHLR